MVLKRNDNDKISGRLPELGENFTGFLGMMQRNEYTVIPKLEAYPQCLEAVDFTYSFWKNR